MLTETVVIFTVLLGLMVLICVLGGSTIPKENFADEVVVDDAMDAPAMAPTPAPAPSPKSSPSPAPAPAPAPKSPASTSMTAQQLHDFATRVYNMKSEQDRMEAIQTLPETHREMITIMVKGMEAGNHSAQKQSTAPTKKTQPPVKQTAPKQQKTAPKNNGASSQPSGTQASKATAAPKPPEPILAPANDLDMATEAPATVEAFTLNAPQERAKPKKPGQPQTMEKAKNVEPFGGNMFALF